MEEQVRWLPSDWGSQRQLGKTGHSKDRRSLSGCHAEKDFDVLCFVVAGFFVFVFVFDVGLHYAAQADLELSVCCLSLSNWVTSRSSLRSFG